MTVTSFFSNLRTFSMPKLLRSFAGKVLVALSLITASLLLGCDSDRKVRQIQDGINNVERHAQEIEDAAQPSAD